MIKENRENYYCDEGILSCYHNGTKCNLSHNSPYFQCNIAITNFLVSQTCEIIFHDVIGQSTVHVHMYSYAKILKHSPDLHGQMSVLDPYFSV